MKAFDKELIFWGIAWALITLASPLMAQQSAPASLSPQELTGKKLFLQRCSVCHLPPLGRPPSARSFGPSLVGYLAARPDRETNVANTIRRGTGRMPGFQYGLEDKDIENIVAFLKTMK